MDGLGQLFIAQNGSVYALVPAESREPPPRHVRAENEVMALLAQILQRQQQQQQQQLQQQQQQQQQQQHLRQEQLDMQLESLAAPHAALQREDALHSLLQATLMQSYPPQLQTSLNTNSGPSTSAPLASGPQMPLQRRRLPSVESPSNSGRSDSQSPPPSTRGGDRNERTHHNGLGVSTHLSAKEKNRQAQRRFRERQKDLIANLKHRVEDLQNRVIENEKEIIALKEENAMLRGRIEGKQQGSSVTLPAETLQSLLQMTGAGSILADVPRPKSGGNGNGGGPSNVAGGSGSYRAARSDDMAAAHGAEVGGRGPEVARRGDFKGDFEGRGSDVD
ncbi:hypothetical protein VaNZ11_000828 [Volvox africanus]|uniref:BZIP domain-containing protein n=1 Tax=Volvox africanus TaxID=51714 RepID=A0ABQ5RN64_9CHLO|nr:hypothetical protein VaNZ11_000828 [Volvox africanus]